MDFAAGHTVASRTRPNLRSGRPASFAIADVPGCGKR